MFCSLGIVYTAPNLQDFQHNNCSESCTPPASLEKFPVYCHLGSAEPQEALGAMLEAEQPVQRQDNAAAVGSTGRSTSRESDPAPVLLVQVGLGVHQFACTGDFNDSFIVC